MNEEQLKKLISHIDRLWTTEKEVKRARAWWDERIKDEALVSAARRRLVEVGIPEDRLLQFPADQVILLDEWREYEARRDEVMKLANLAPWQAEELGIGRPYKRSKDTGLLADLLVPALSKVHRAQGRL